MSGGIESAIQKMVLGSRKILNILTSLPMF